ncbi:MAG: SDR family oxidoreductase [Dehalococcoidales bacterium]|nr:SDR family oxidoreductase [Dehalococcoidales bacterium]
MQQFKPQHQERQPGIESRMEPKPASKKLEYTGSGKLRNKVALITGGDSGIGRAVAILFAREGADISIVYYEEHQDAAETRSLVEKEGRQCMILAGDVGQPKFCQQAVETTVRKLGKLDILVNNAAVQYPQDRLEKISASQLLRTFRTNILSMFYMTQAALKYLNKGAVIINTTSVTAYRGSRYLIDYASTKGAIVSFTRSLGLALADQGIRVNGVAPGPIWTPLIPSSFPAEHVEKFGAKEPMQRAGQPEEVAPCYVFLASELDSSYMTGQVLHPNGGEIVNG